MRTKRRKELVPLVCCVCGKDRDRGADDALEVLCSSCTQIVCRQIQDIPWRLRKVDKNY